MNAEALIGTVLGTSTLQQLIGQGGMGAVYLAQQSRPRRQVAVKVLMPATALKPHQLSAFLERFRRETDAAASLEHPNIMPVYEYGERGGLAFLVMPYISGGTLRDVMENDGQMDYSVAMNYLEQMAAALDFAHVRGVIHRDIKPANMLLTPDGRLLLTDFGLVKLLFDNQSEQVRLTGAGAPVGTPDYMSPEQVIGGEVDGRADQYSLGVVLYQMLTATTPFQGETPMQIAAQQLHMQPPAPRLMRSDLPEAVEQVLLRAMAKHPDERFSSCQEFAAAFRAMITATQTQAGGMSTRGGGLLANAGLRKGGLFDPKWQTTNNVPVVNPPQLDMPLAPMSPQGMPAPTATLSLDTGLNPAVPRPAGTGLLSRAGLFPKVGDNTGTMPTAARMEGNTTTGLFASPHLSTATGAQPAMSTQANLFGQAAFPGVQQDTAAAQTGLQSSLFAQPTGAFQQPFTANNIQQLSPAQPTTTTLSLLNSEQKGGNTIKLTGPVKVVQVAVAPGQYVTGLLPVQKEQAEQPAEQPLAPRKSRRTFIMLGAVLVILLGTFASIVTLMHAHSGPSSATQSISGATPNPAATAIWQATATASENVVFADPLSQNIHNFPVANSGAKQYMFANGAYDILNNGLSSVAVVVQSDFPQTTLDYQITMHELKGDDTSANNTFGMILRYKTAANGSYMFYTFEVLNEKGGSEYRFYKYDSTNTKNPWDELWHVGAGKEFQEGQGKGAINTIKVLAAGSQFTFTVNGQKVGTFKDGSIPSGSMGMLVNNKGTQVAFSNMLITKS
jgi:serine/threonine protein kinase